MLPLFFVPIPVPGTTKHTSAAGVKIRKVVNKHRKLETVLALLVIIPSLIGFACGD